MQEVTEVHSVLKIENHAKKLYITLSDREGESVEVKMGMTQARELIKLLFRQVDPNWGGEREGAGKRRE